MRAGPEIEHLESLVRDLRASTQESEKQVETAQADAAVQITNAAKTELLAKIELLEKQAKIEQLEQQMSDEAHDTSHIIRMMNQAAGLETLQQTAGADIIELAAAVAKVSELEKALEQANAELEVNGLTAVDSIVHPSGFTVEELDGYLNQLFQIADKTGAGVLAPAEVTKILLLCELTMAPDSIQEMVAAAVNDQGLIIYAEFVLVLRKKVEELELSEVDSAADQDAQQASAQVAQLLIDLKESSTIRKALQHELMSKDQKSAEMGQIHTQQLADRARIIELEGQLAEVQAQKSSLEDMLVKEVNAVDELLARKRRW